MNDPANSEVVVLKWLPKSSAPPRIQKYIDPDCVLDPEVKFIPAFNPSRFDVVFQWFITVLMLCLALGMIDVMSRAANKPNVWVQVSVISVVSLMFLASVWSLKKKISAHKHKKKTLFAQGKYRSGLYLLSDALLIYFDDNFYYAPQKNIDRFSAVFRGRSQGRRLEMVVAADDGHKMVLDMDFLKLNNVIMQRELSQWLFKGRREAEIHQ